MAKRQRRHSQNGQLMRKVLEHLREYDLEEVQLLCEKYKAQESSSSRRSRRSSTRKSSRKSARKKET